MEVSEEKEIMAYIAGLIDGDGSIWMKRVTDGYLPRVNLSNSCEQICQYLRKLFGGTVSFSAPRKEGQRSMYSWLLQGKEGCRTVLNSIYPYLAVKKDSAFEILEFLNHPKEGKDYCMSCKEINISRKINSSSAGVMPSLDVGIFFWSYLAGLMDTDGSFSIERSIRKPSTFNRQKNDLIKYRARLSLSMVSEIAFTQIKRMIPFGSFSKIKARSALRGFAFRWSVCSKSDVIECLKKLIPYLQIKSQQCLLLLDFCRNYTPTKGVAKVPEGEILYRDKCYNKMINLNENGHLK